MVMMMLTAPRAYMEARVTHVGGIGPRASRRGPRHRLPEAYQSTRGLPGTPMLMMMMVMPGCDDGDLKLRK